MPRRTKDEAEATRQTLIDAALAVFSAKGYNATRLEDIAAEAGVTRGAIYHHFGSKAELYGCMIDSVLGEIVPLIDAAIRDGKGTLDTLRRIFVTPLHHAATNARFREASELMYFKTEAVPELMEGMEDKNRANQIFVGQVAGIIQQGMANEEIRPDVDPRDAAMLLVSLQGGLLALWMMDETLIDLKARAGAVADIFLRGLAK